VPVLKLTAAADDVTLLIAAASVVGVTVYTEARDVFVKLPREESPEEVLLRKLAEARLLVPGVRILAEGKEEEEEEEAAASSSRGTEGLRRADWGSGC
jgi:hypothetical protein